MAGDEDEHAQLRGGDDVLDLHDRAGGDAHEDVGGAQGGLHLLVFAHPSFLPRIAFTRADRAEG
jgi:hypothetical protein